MSDIDIEPSLPPGMKQLVPGGHIFETGDTGDVNDFALEDDYHNGPHCVKCNRYFCEPCERRAGRDVYTEACDGKNIVVLEEKPSVTKEVLP